MRYDPEVAKLLGEIKRSMEGGARNGTSDDLARERGG